jgi:hypothetical protein
MGRRLGLPSDIIYTSMADTAEGQTPFDERAALEELERLRQGIEHYRLQRKAVGEKFEAFVGSFQKPAGMQLVPVKPAAPAPAAPPPSPLVQTAAPAQVPALEAAPVQPPPPAPPIPAAAPMPAPPPASEPMMDALTARLRGIPSDAWATPSVTSSVTEESNETPAESATPPRRSRVAVLAALVVVLVAVLGWTLWPRAAAPTGSDQPATTAAPAAIPAPPPSAPPPPAPAAAAPVVEVPAAEVTTTRAVWLRVIVDGERVLERQLPADTRVPLKAEKTIVIRTGDAGAVRVSIGGQDQGPLGKDGQVVNRSFTVPPKAER